MPRLLFVCAFGALSGSAIFGPMLLAPPGPPTSGLLMGSPLGWTTEDIPPIQVKAPGFTPGPPPTPPPGVPVVDFAGFVPWLVAGQNDWVSPLLAMSLGIDVISTTEVKVTSANVEPPGLPWIDGWYPLLGISSHGWYAIEFTVDTFQIKPSEYAYLATDVLSAGLDRDRSVFCYVLPASSTATGGQYLLPDETVTTCILLPSHLGISSTRDVIHAMNMHIGLYQTDLADSAQFRTRDLPEYPTLYFTLRKEFFDSIDEKVFLNRFPDLNSQSLTEGTIFKSTWTDAGWSPVTIYATAHDLGIPNPGTAIIDGLAIDSLKSTPEMIFSLRDWDERDVEPSDQMMHAYPPTTTTPAKPPRRVVIELGGRFGPLGRQMGAGRGIGDFCTADPWIPTARFKTFSVTASTLVDDYQFARRKPNPLVGPTHVVLPISALRAWDGTATQVRVCMATPRYLTNAISNGVVRIFWDYTNDVTVGNPKSGWKLVDKFPLPAGPFEHDFPLIRDPGPKPPTVRGIVARWELHANGRVWHSPVAALRY